MFKSMKEVILFQLLLWVSCLSYVELATDAECRAGVGGPACVTFCKSYNFDGNRACKVLINNANVYCPCTAFGTGTTLKGQTTPPTKSTTTSTSTSTTTKTTTIKTSTTTTTNTANCKANPGTCLSLCKSYNFDPQRACKPAGLTTYCNCSLFGVAPTKVPPITTKPTTKTTAVTSTTPQPTTTQPTTPQTTTPQPSTPADTTTVSTVSDTTALDTTTPNPAV